MHDYLVYTLWLVIPSVVGFVLFYVFSIALCCYAGGSIFGVTKFLFGDIIEKRDDEDDEEYFTAFVLIAAFQLMGCAILTFWYEFLVDVTYSCDPNLDCYPFPVGFGTAVTWSMPPIENCSDYEILPDNMTIVCLTFSFDYPGAIGQTGGVFAFAALGMRFITGIVIWLQSRGRVRCGYILVFSLWIVYFAVTILVYLLGTLVPVFRPLIVGPPKQIQFFVYSMTFFLGFVLVPAAYLWQSRSKTPSADDDFAKSY